MLVSASKAGVTGGLVVDPAKYPFARDGWPSDSGWT